MDCLSSLSEASWQRDISTLAVTSMGGMEYVPELTEKIERTHKQRVSSQWITMEFDNLSTSWRLLGRKGSHSLTSFSTQGVFPFYLQCQTRNEAGDRVGNLLMSTIIYVNGIFFNLVWRALLTKISSSWLHHSTPAGLFASMQQCPKIDWACNHVLQCLVRYCRDELPVVQKHSILLCPFLRSLQQAMMADISATERISAVVAWEMHSQMWFCRIAMDVPINKCTCSVPRSFKPSSSED